MIEGNCESKSAVGDNRNRRGNECKAELVAEGNIHADASTTQCISLSQETQEECLPSAFDYGEWLSIQEYYDDYKHSQHKHICFPFFGSNHPQEHEHAHVCEAGNGDDANSGRTSPVGVDDRLDTASNASDIGPAKSATKLTSVIIQQDRSLGRGGIVWCAGYILADHVLRSYANLLQSSNTRILELGAGTGVTSVGIAANSNATVVITDLEPLLPLIRINASLNRAKLQGRVHVEPLPWGELSAAVASHGPYDMIVAADCVYADCAHDLLPSTISMYAHENTVFVMTCRIRLEEPVEQFEHAMKKRFRFVERALPNSFNRNPGVILMTATGLIVPDSASEERQ